MRFEEWIIEHLIEVVSMLIFGTATYYLIQINKNQKASIVNSPNSVIQQIHGPFDPSALQHFREDSEKLVRISKEIPEIDKEPKELIEKIESYLDEGKPISTIAEMCLRLSQKLTMKKDIVWLSKEIYGFREYLEKDFSRKGLESKKIDKKYTLYNYRGVEAELNLQFGKRMPEKFPIKIFISQPLSQIESWINYDPMDGRMLMSNLIAMWAPPSQLMVEHFKTDPKEKVPYVIKRSSLQYIIKEVRLKLIEFITRAKKKLK